ncbi:TetR/AcrR family transcriptional regulator C-terminal domain-containing protein [Planosporangium sp. 12N6]|uniref:TetR/AcrR family transcriptional regulator C-terminal domain-containing protein n=1 Tax=Planosporangium spinosum TaxID=3402278 RepID=UPI003CEC7E9E
MSDAPGKPRRSASPGGMRLSRQRILTAALDIIDQQGLAGLSMRRLGAALGVEGMSLYHHFPNKQALLDGVVELVTEAGAPDDAGSDDDWRSLLRRFATSYRATLLAHPRVLPLVATRPVTTPRSLRAVERSATVLHRAGFTLDQALNIITGIACFVIGHTLAEVEPDDGRPDPADGVPVALAALDPDEFPLLTRALTTGAGANPDTRFTFTLDSLLAGMDQQRGPTNSAAAPADPLSE